MPHSARTDTSTTTFYVSKNIVLVPPFREAEEDNYFSVFEHKSIALDWPKDVWSFLLQYKLVGKAQEVYPLLFLQDSLKYELVKATILRAYELVHEACRQRFRSLKVPSQTYVVFAALYWINGVLQAMLRP